MMRKLMIVRYTYIPNNAPINRLLAFAKGYGENGINTTVYFLRPDNLNSKVDKKFENVQFEYLWENNVTRNKYLNFIFSLLRLFLLLKPDIPVIFYGVREYLFFFRLRYRVKIYYEMTEHPSLFYNFDKITDRLKYKIYINACRRLDGLFVISPSLANFYINEVHVDKDKVHIANMVVDKKRFIGLNNNPESPIISYCGTVSMYKDGVDILIKSFALIHKKYPKLKLRVIGPFMSKNDEIELRNLSSLLHLNNYIDFTGKISADKMPSVLSDSKILVLSRPNNKQAKYGFPTKLGEYLMTGVPVLVTKVGDIGCYLTDKESVIFATPDSFDDFYMSLDWIISNYDKALKIARQGRLIASKKFDYFIESKNNIEFIYK